MDLPNMDDLEFLASREITQYKVERVSEHCELKDTGPSQMSVVDFLASKEITQYKVKRISEHREPPKCTDPSQMSVVEFLASREIPFDRVERVGEHRDYNRTHPSQMNSIDFLASREIPKLTVEELRNQNLVSRINLLRNDDHHDPIPLDIVLDNMESALDLMNMFCTQYLIPQPTGNAFLGTPRYETLNIEPLVLPSPLLDPNSGDGPSSSDASGPFMLTQDAISSTTWDKHQEFANMNGTYGQRLPLNVGQYGMGNHQGPLVNLTNLKSALPSPITGEHPASGHRVGQTHPVMVLPSGQAVPVSAFLPQNQNTNEQVSYSGNGIYNGFMNNTHLAQGGMNNYNTPYGFQAGLTDFESGRRAGWSVNDENAHYGAVGPTITQDFYPGYSFAGAVDNSTYIAGPIQPMKTKDNKGYEMVNLDELVTRDPPIPRAVPALWTNQDDLSLAKCLQNPEGITNIYIRGFMPDTTDDDLNRWASRFGKIESCKAIVEQDTGKCKGFGFVMYYSPAAAENCIRGFFHLGFQASYAQKSRNARLKDLEDKSSTNIYCTGVPIDWNEADLAKHFLPYRAVSTKICRDTPSGVSKEVGFARFETRDVAERVIRDFHSVHNEHDDVKLFLRFADTKAQKQLKLQSQERRTWRSREYSYSVEHTPSPTLMRFHNAADGVSPGSYQSPAGAGPTFTPDTSVSPPEAQAGKQAVATMTSRATNVWPMQGGLQTITNTTVTRGQSVVPTTIQALPVIKTEATSTVSKNRAAKTPSPKKTAAGTGDDVGSTTPQSAE